MSGDLETLSSAGQRWFAGLALLGCALALGVTLHHTLASAVDRRAEVEAAAERFERAVRTLAEKRGRERSLAARIDGELGALAELDERVVDARVVRGVHQVFAAVTDRLCRGVGSPALLLDGAADLEARVQAAAHMVGCLAQDAVRKSNAAEVREAIRAAEETEQARQSARLRHGADVAGREKLLTEIARLESLTATPPPDPRWLEWPRLLLDGALLVLLLRLAWHFLERWLLYLGVFAPSRLPEVAPHRRGAPAVEMSATPPGTFHWVNPHAGRFFFATAFHRSRSSGLDWRPPAPLGSPIARLLHGRYWLRRHDAGPGAPPLTLVAPLDAPPGAVFATLTLRPGQSVFVDVERLVGFSGAVRPHTLLGGLVRPACWLLGHPLPVAFTLPDDAAGPGLIVVFGQALRRADETAPVTAPAAGPDAAAPAQPATPAPAAPRWRPVVNVDCVVAFPADAPFTIRTPGGQNPLARVADALWSKVDFRFEGPPAALLIEERAVRAASLLAELPRLARHFLLMALLSAGTLHLLAGWLS